MHCYHLFITTHVFTVKHAKLLITSIELTIACMHVASILIQLPIPNEVHDHGHSCIGNDQHKVGHADWVAGEGAAAGGKGYTGASGTRRALAWCCPFLVDFALQQQQGGVPQGRVLHHMLALCIACHCKILCSSEGVDVLVCFDW